MRASDPTNGGAVPPLTEELEIARLARRQNGGAESGAATRRGGATRLAVGLHRDKLAVDDHAMYFRLKMALARGLRRPFRRALIEIDDLAGAPGQRPFEVIVEPADTEMQARAEAVVARVIRLRRWRAGEPPADHAGQEH